MSVEDQLVLEEVFNKNQLKSKLYEVYKKLGFEEYIESKGVDLKFGMSLLSQMYLRKRASVPTVVGLLAHLYDMDVQRTADELWLAVKAKLVQYVPGNDRELIILHELPDSVASDIRLFQYPLPLVAEPNKVVNNAENSYYSTKKKVLLGTAYHFEDINLDHLNKMNHVKLSLNMDVVKNTCNEWPSLKKRKDGESLFKFHLRQRQMDNYRKYSLVVCDLINEAGNEFYLDHGYDFRGRTYANGYHINYQGHEYNKGVIEFANKELVEG